MRRLRLPSLKTQVDILLYRLLVVTCLGVMVYAQVWKEKPVIDWDVTIYYSYLPATFLYEEFQFDPQRNPEWAKRHFFWQKTKSGKEYQKMTAGLAVLYAPFFGLGHLGASLSPTWPEDGFSLPYRMALLLSSLFYVLWGLHLLRLVLRHFFAPGPAGLALVAIFAGTNLPYYTMVEPMSHGYSFMLVCALLWAYLRFWKKPAWPWGGLFGLLAGLIVWIRPTNGVVLLLPMLHWLFQPVGAGPTHWRTLALSVGVAFLTVFPQLLYWHSTTGQWLVYSYGEQGFFWGDPELWKGFFSYRKGWFTYAPILWLALPGWLFWARTHPRWAGVGLLVLALASYVTFSWWSWWYGGGYGARPLIEFLPLMALALGALFQYLRGLRPLWQGLAFVLGLYLVSWSVFMNKQYYFGIIHYDGMTRELFWAQFWKDDYVKNYDALVDRPDYEAALKNQE